MKRFIKFCGMRESVDIAVAADLGVDAIGLVLVPGSPRAISIEDAARLRQAIPMGLEVFALVRDADAETVERIYHDVSPHYVQFHGSEPAAFCEQFERPYCKAMSLAEPDLESRILEFATADRLIFDGHAPGATGGSGERGDWSRFPRGLGDIAILAGGLKPSNVRQAILESGCSGVDVSSGIESAPGVKSHARMSELVRIVRALD